MENKDRSGFIGGSDAAGVLGKSRWATPLSVWAEKTGQYIKPEVDSEALELGRELEDYVAKRFERKTGKTAARSGGTFFHPDHNFLGANVDRLIVGEDAGLECKTASAWKSKEWEGEEIPQEYILQCYHYMMVTGRKKWYLAVLIGNQDFKIRELAWEDSLIKNMREREVDFWERFVIPKVMPSQVNYKDTDVLDGLFPSAQEGQIVELSDDANILVENLTALKQDAKSLDKQIETAENELKRLVGTAEMGQTGLYRVFWSNMRSRRFDAEAFKRAHPRLDLEFRKEKITRRFSYKPLKG